MDPIVKEKWIDALRSGKYKQCEGRLRDDVGFCCLGVLTDLYIKEATDDSRFWEEGEYGGECYFSFRNSVKTLDKSVSEWANLADTYDPKVIDTHLSAYNDGWNVPKKSFDEIADLIERYL